MSLTTLLTPLRFLSFLFSSTFWTKIGFFISYIATFLLVLEVVRLASSDAKRKEVERLIDVYAAERSEEMGTQEEERHTNVLHSYECRRRGEEEEDGRGEDGEGKGQGKGHGQGESEENDEYK
ncbi:hypothetical protein HRS9139_07797 [Pyrenophora teres f. teres]|nr:hypothetical protein HRS9139_07797 [Pyrenophora teres f. teres]